MILESGGTFVASQIQHVFQNAYQAKAGCILACSWDLLRCIKSQGLYPLLQKSLGQALVVLPKSGRSQQQQTSEKRASMLLLELATGI